MKNQKSTNAEAGKDTKTETSTETKKKEEGFSAGNETNQGTKIGFSSDLD